MLDLYAICKIHNSLYWSLYGSELYNIIVDIFKRSMLLRGKQWEYCSIYIIEINYVVCGILNVSHITLFKSIPLNFFFQGFHFRVILVCFFWVNFTPCAEKQYLFIGGLSQDLTA